MPTCWSEEEDECEECSLTAGPFCLGKDGGVGLKMDAGDGGKVATCLHGAKVLKPAPISMGKAVFGLWDLLAMG